MRNTYISSSDLAVFLLSFRKEWLICEAATVGFLGPRDLVLAKTPDNLAEGEAGSAVLSSTNE